MCCHPQLELGRFDCLQAPHGNWEVEGGGECTDAVAIRPGCLWHFGDFENGEGHNAKEGMWVRRAQMRGRGHKACRRKMPVKAARI